MLAVLLLWDQTLAAQEDSRRTAARELPEYQVKAAFLLNFARFVEWPATQTVGVAGNSPLTICIAGDDPFGGTLDRLARGEAVNGRPVVIRRFWQRESTCQILFVSGSERDLFRALGRAEPGVLTVGEDAAFLTEGGMINFVVEDRRVRFDVNLKAAERASVRISSRLLSVARSVLR